MSFKGTAMMAAKVVTKVTKGKAAEAVTKVSKPRVFKESQLSAELGQLVNATTLTRPQALKALWGYIK
jgi:chromatin remodeling complex protein RSC6